MVRNLIRAVLLKACSAVSGVALSFVVARSMTAQDAGIIFYSISLLLAITTVAMLGLDASVMRELSSRGASYLSSNMRHLAFVSRSVSLLASIFVVFVIGGYLLATHYSRVGAEAASSPLIFTAIFIPFFSRLCVNAEILRGSGFHNAQVSYVNLAVPLVYVVALLIAGVAGWRFSVYQWLFIYGLTIVLITIASELHVQQIGVVLPPDESVFKNLMPTLSLSLPLLFVSGFQSLIHVIPTALAGSVLGSSEAAHFHVAYRVALLISFVLASVNVVFAPALARAYHQGDEKAATDLLRVSSALGFVIGLPIFVVCVLFGGELLSIFGLQYKAAESLLIILAFSQFINSSTGCVFVFLVMTRSQAAAGYINGVSVLLLTVFGYLALHRFGLVGLAWVAACVIILGNMAALVMIRRQVRAWITPLFDLSRVVEMGKFLLR